MHVQSANIQKVPIKHMTRVSINNFTTAFVNYTDVLLNVSLISTLAIKVYHNDAAMGLIYSCIYADALGVLLVFYPILGVIVSLY